MTHLWLLAISSLALASKRPRSQSSLSPTKYLASTKQNGMADFSLHKAFQENTSLPLILLDILALNLGRCMASLDHEGRTPLHYLPAWARNCSVEQYADPDAAKSRIICLLYKASDRAIDQTDHYGRTALHCAVGVDTLSTSVLVHLGARGEVCDVHGRWAVNMPGSFSAGKLRCMLQERKLLQTKIMAIILATAGDNGNMIENIPREVIMVIMVQMMRLYDGALSEHNYDDYHYQPATLTIARELVGKICISQDEQVFPLPTNIQEKIFSHLDGRACIQRKLF